MAPRDAEGVTFACCTVIMDLSEPVILNLRPTLLTVDSCNDCASSGSVAGRCAICLPWLLADTMYVEEVNRHCLGQLWSLSHQCSHQWRLSSLVQSQAFPWACESGCRKAGSPWGTPSCRLLHALLQRMSCVSTQCT